MALVYTSFYIQLLILIKLPEIIPWSRRVGQYGF